MQPSPDIHAMSVEDGIISLLQDSLQGNGHRLALAPPLSATRASDSQYPHRRPSQIMVPQPAARLARPILASLVKMPEMVARLDGEGGKSPTAMCPRQTSPQSGSIAHVRCLKICKLELPERHADVPGGALRI